jgi:D-alanyl-D-alanine dipeptidase
MMRKVSGCFKVAAYSFLLVIAFACSPSERTTESKADPVAVAEQHTKSAADTAAAITGLDSKAQVSPISPRQLLSQQQQDTLPDSAFVDLLTLDSTFVLDMRYATDSNFLKARVYDCDQCLLRAVVAKALVKVQQSLSEKGYRIKLYDCYRPLDIQKRMWKIMPDDRYVGNPYGNGSVHNKGAAVDLTLVDAQRHELDMGTGLRSLSDGSASCLPEPVPASTGEPQTAEAKHGEWVVSYPLPVNGGIIFIKKTATQ